MLSSTAQRASDNLGRLTRETLTSTVDSNVLQMAVPTTTPIRKYNASTPPPEAATVNSINGGLYID